jgi:ribonuclease-3
MPDEAEAAGLERALGYTFSDRALLLQALVHRSAELEGEGVSNERLEFLGDAVLSVVVAHEMYLGGGLNEGEMAKVRAAVVSEGALAAVARRIGLGSHLVLGRGEEATGGREKSSILADAMEAVIGAMFLDGGFDAARRFVSEEWRDHIVERSAAPGGRDFKTRLQEVLARDGLRPDYDTEGSGPDHERMFTATVSVDGRELGTGAGTSKKRAEQEAARAALALLGGGDA